MVGILSSLQTPGIKPAYPNYWMQIRLKRQKKKKAKKKYTRTMSVRYFPIKPFFFHHALPLCLLTDTNIAASRRYNFASKPTQ